MGNVRRFVKVPFAHGGGGGASGVARTGAGHALKGARMSELSTKRPGRPSTPSERGDTLRQAVNRQKAITKTQTAVLNSDTRLLAHRRAKKSDASISLKHRILSKTQVRREGRLQRNLRGRLEEINPIRSIGKRRKK